jgi:NADP-dependent 3-hydroxy acid dehydrogenase YdfG
MTGSLAGRVALVTGASAGIGEAVAVVLAAAGATVAVAARREDRLKALVEKIEDAGGKALALPGDVAREAVAKGMVAETARHFGRLDILINSAGLIQSGGIEKSDTAHWRQLLEVNLLASLYTCQAAIPTMRAQGGGDIINISSTAGRRAAAAFPAYSASKFGLTAMNEAMRVHYRAGCHFHGSCGGDRGPHHTGSHARAYRQGRRPAAAGCGGRSPVRPRFAGASQYFTAGDPSDDRRFADLSHGAPSP